MTPVVVNQQSSGGTMVAQATYVPSEQPVTLYDVLIDRVGEEDWLRFRFLAPRIGKAADDLSFAQVEADFEHLCQSVALPYLIEFDLHADVVVVSLSDREVTFGERDPDATQFIEAFRLVDGTCEIEGL